MLRIFLRGSDIHPRGISYERVSHASCNTIVSIKFLFLTSPEKIYSETVRRDAAGVPFDKKRITNGNISYVRPVKVLSLYDRVS